MSKKTSMEEIAKIFNVSKVTVSKALNDKEGVSEELRKTIKEKADELGYFANSAAKSLKLNKNFNIGVVIPLRFIGGSSSFYFETYTKLVMKLTELGYSVMLEILNPDQENNKVFPDMYKNGKIDGLIIMGQSSDSYLSLFTDAYLPVLLFDFYSYNHHLDCIVVDNFTSGYKVTEHLIKKGHKEIGFVGNIYSTSSIQDRFLGFYRALLGHHLILDNEHIISDRDDSGHFIPFVLPKHMPTAFVCNNDQIAYEFVNELKKLNYNIPKDISIITFDNTLYSQKSSPKLTTICVNVDDMVEMTSKIIVKKMNNKDKRYNEVLIQTELIERNSICDLK
ncbi:MAG: substrate-binding domain-containing protein [Candidatus Izemoplasmatales bacterium]|jgi:LacI family transcriptional regulator|nr:substrate-binding domain-containing protein [Candidatus Izemoplasmatales bacterium]MDY0241300.1 substrate-binding domain-containing protein [Rhodospirillaceae bacterium]